MSQQQSVVGNYIEIPVGGFSKGDLLVGRTDTRLEQLSPGLPGQVLTVDAVSESGFAYTTPPFGIGTSHGLLTDLGADDHAQYMPVVGRSANYHSTSSVDYVIIGAIDNLGVITSSNTCSVTLPDPTVNVDRKITVQKIDSGTGIIQVKAAGGSLINGKLTSTIYYEDQAVTFFSRGSTWHILASSPCQSLHIPGTVPEMGASAQPRFADFGAITLSGEAASIILPADAALSSVTANYIGTVPLSLNVGETLDIEVGTMALGNSAIPGNFNAVLGAPLITWNSSHAYPNTTVSDIGAKFAAGTKIAVRTRHNSPAGVPLASKIVVLLTFWVKNL